MEVLQSPDSDPNDKFRRDLAGLGLGELPQEEEPVTGGEDIKEPDFIDRVPNTFSEAEEQQRINDSRERAGLPQKVFGAREVEAIANTEKVELSDMAEAIKKDSTFAGKVSEAFTDYITRVNDPETKQVLTRMAIALGLTFAIGAGVASIAERSQEQPKSEPAREQVINQSAESDGDQGGVNDILKETYENGDELKGLDYISEEAPLDANDVNQIVKDNLELQRAADEKGQEIDDGLDTSKLE